jgi:ABC-type transport system involved in multi-copper enzyme maturation permease subunit
MFAIIVSEFLALAALGVLLLVGVVVGVFLLAGLFQARSLVKREFGAYFISPIAYVVLVVFLTVLGVRFYLTLDQLTTTGPRGAEYPIQFLFSLLPVGSESISLNFRQVLQLLSAVAFWFVYLLIPPLLTMRLFAEERGSGTLEMLMTVPLRDWQVVLSKYVACFGFYLFLWLPTLVYVPVLIDLQRPTWNAAWTPYSFLFLFGLAAFVVGVVLALVRLGTTGRLVNLALFLGGPLCAAVGGWLHYRRDSVHIVELTSALDPAPVLATYLGLILVGAMLLALGLLVSSLVRSQLVAALVSVGVSLGLLIAGFLRSFLDSSSALGQVLDSFGVPLHISQDFARGLVDTRHLVLYTSVALFSLFLTVRSLESRRWR